jgi:hypothetical protein
MRHLNFIQYCNVIQSGGKIMNYAFKRKHLRAKVNELITVHYDEGYTVLRSGSISENGMFIHCVESVWNIGEKLKFYFRLKGSSKPIIPSGEIVNYVLKKGFCIKFTNISNDDTEIIKKYVNRHFSENDSTSEFLIPFYKSIKNFSKK